MGRLLMRNCLLRNAKTKAVLSRSITIGKNGPSTQFGARPGTFGSLSDDSFAGLTIQFMYQEEPSATFQFRIDDPSATLVKADLDRLILNTAHLGFVTLNGADASFFQVSGLTTWEWSTGTDDYYRLADVGLTLGWDVFQ